MERRNFIKGFVGLGSMCFVNWSEAMEGLRINCYEKNIMEKIIRLLNYGVLAPSTHNTQPWKVLLDENAIIVKGDNSRKLLCVDANNREWLLSLSAFVQTILYAGNGMGLSMDIEHIYDKENFGDPQFKIHFSENEGLRNKYILDIIQSRYTDRTSYDSNEISYGTVNQILNLDKENLVYFSKDSWQGRIIGEAQIEAFIQQSNNVSMQTELGQWLRFNKEDKDKKGDGIFPEMLGLNKISKFVWYNSFSEKTALNKSFINTSIKNTRKQLKNLSGFLVITSKRNDIESTISAGLLYQKVLLKCTEHNIKNHTISQTLEEEPWKSTIHKNIGMFKPIQFIIRVGTNNTKGYGKAIRRNVNTIILK